MFAWRPMSKWEANRNPFWRSFVDNIVLINCPDSVFQWMHNLTVLQNSYLNIHSGLKNLLSILRVCFSN